MSSLYELMSESTFDSNALRRYLISHAELAYTRTVAYARAKEFRTLYPACFVRVLKVGNVYFVITNQNDYMIYWEARKLALRNERRMKNEIV